MVQAETGAMPPAAVGRQRGSAAVIGALPPHFFLFKDGLAALAFRDGVPVQPPPPPPESTWPLAKQGQRGSPYKQRAKGRGR